MGNNVEREFDIHLLGLKKDPQIFEYQIGKEFFENFDQDIVESGQLHAQATVLKTNAMVTVALIINGTIDRICDRSLEMFSEPLHIETTLYFKFGETEEELDVNLYQIDYETITLNLAQYILECILVEIPYRAIHPKYRNQESDDESGVFFQTEADPNEEDEPDPRWEGLRDLKKRLN